MEYLEGMYSKTDLQTHYLVHYIVREIRGNAFHIVRAMRWDMYGWYR